MYSVKTVNVPLKRTDELKPLGGILMSFVPYNWLRYVVKDLTDDLLILRPL